MSPGRIVLELTEREAIRDPERLRIALLGVQNAGVRVAADDVGAGNAGLRLLSQFRFDVVKIDLSLVQRGDERPDASRSCARSSRWPSGWARRRSPRASRRPASCGRRGGSASPAGQGYLLGRPGPERDLTWVDIAALEQREDIAIPIRAEPGAGPAPRSLAARLAECRRPGRRRARAARRVAPGGAAGSRRAVGR